MSDERWPIMSDERWPIPATAALVVAFATVLWFLFWFLLWGTFAALGWDTELWVQDWPWFARVGVGGGLLVGWLLVAAGVVWVIDEGKR